MSIHALANFIIVIYLSIVISAIGSVRVKTDWMTYHLLPGLSLGQVGEDHAIRISDGSQTVTSILGYRYVEIGIHRKDKYRPTIQQGTFNWCHLSSNIIMT